MKMHSATKINVVGTSGTGKSTFSRRLAQKLDFRYIEMDLLFWKPDWTQPTDEEFFSKLQGALVGDKWVLDGNYSRTVPIKWEKAEMVIWLDYSFTRTLFQAIKRALKRSLTQEELWEGTGNRESLRRSFFSKESIIWWMITTYSGVRLKYEACMKDPKYAHIHFIRLRSPRETENFLEAKVQS